MSLLPIECKECRDRELQLVALQTAADEALAIIRTVKHSPPFSARIERCMDLLKAALASTAGANHE